MNKSVLFLLAFFPLAAFAKAPAAKPAAPAPKSAAIACPDLKVDRPSVVWYVPKGATPHFADAEGGKPGKTYVVYGDLLIPAKETWKSVFACYRSKGKIAASGWLLKSELSKFETVTFGSFEVAESQAKIPKSYAALKALAKNLPAVSEKNWPGKWQDANANPVEIKKKGVNLGLNVSDIPGAISTGDDEDDLAILKIEGAFAEVRENVKKIDVCDTVIVRFNNAIYGVSGTRCMGSGAGGEYPEFLGIYWLN